MIAASWGDESKKPTSGVVGNLPKPTTKPRDVYHQNKNITCNNDYIIDINDNGIIHEGKKNFLKNEDYTTHVNTIEDDDVNHSQSRRGRRLMHNTSFKSIRALSPVATSAIKKSAATSKSNIILSATSATPTTKRGIQHGRELVAAARRSSVKEDVVRTSKVTTLEDELNAWLNRFKTPTTTNNNSDDDSALHRTNTNSSVLPKGWKSIKDPSSCKIYYYNKDTGETSWETPNMTFTEGTKNAYTTESHESSNSKFKSMKETTTSFAKKQKQQLSHQVSQANLQLKRSTSRMKIEVEQLLSKKRVEMEQLLSRGSSQGREEIAKQIKYQIINKLRNNKNITRRIAGLEGSSSNFMGIQSNNNRKLESLKKLTKSYSMPNLSALTGRGNKNDTDNDYVVNISTDSPTGVDDNILSPLSIDDNDDEDDLVFNLEERFINDAIIHDGASGGTYDTNDKEVITAIRVVNSPPPVGDDINNNVKHQQQQQVELELITTTVTTLKKENKNAEEEQIIELKSKAKNKLDDEVRVVATDNNEHVEANVDKLFKKVENILNEQQQQQQGGSSLDKSSLTLEEAVQLLDMIMKRGNNESPSSSAGRSRSLGLIDQEATEDEYDDASTHDDKSINSYEDSTARSTGTGSTDVRYIASICQCNDVMDSFEQAVAEFVLQERVEDDWSYDDECSVSSAEDERGEDGRYYHSSKKSGSNHRKIRRKRRDEQSGNSSRSDTKTGRRALRRMQVCLVGRSIMKRDVVEEVFHRLLPSGTRRYYREVITLRLALIQYSGSWMI